MKSINVGFIAPLLLVRGVLTILSDMPTIYAYMTPIRQIKTVRNQNNKHQQNTFGCKLCGNSFRTSHIRQNNCWWLWGVPSFVFFYLSCVLDWSVSKGKDTKTRNKSNRNCACINVQYHPIPLHRFYRDKDNSLQDSKGLTLVWVLKSKKLAFTFDNLSGINQVLISTGAQ